MARSRKRARRSGFSMKRRSGRRSKGGSNPMALILPAMAYGAGRSYLSNMAQPITSKLGFLGNYADEALFGVAGWYLMKKNFMGLGKVGQAMLIVESASVGSQLVGQLTNSNSSSSNSSFDTGF